MKVSAKNPCLTNQEKGNNNRDNNCIELMDFKVMSDGTQTAKNYINKPQTTSTINSDNSDSSLSLSTRIPQQISHKRKRIRNNSSF